MEEMTPEMEALIEQHQDIYSENNASIERLEEKYSINAGRENQSGLMLEHLINYLYPIGSEERVKFDISFEEMFKDRLHKAEAHYSAQAFKNKGKRLVIPGHPSLGIVKP